MIRKSIKTQKRIIWMERGCFLLPNVNIVKVSLDDYDEDGGLYV